MLEAFLVKYQNNFVWNGIFWCPKKSDITVFRGLIILSKVNRKWYQMFWETLYAQYIFLKDEI